MVKILIIHGPNLNLLGQREKNIYGASTLAEINQQMAEQVDPGAVQLEFVQSNHEGEIVDIIGSAKDKGFEAIVINPAAYTHTSVAIRDAIGAVDLPAFEVHISNIYSREDFRQKSLIAPVCKGQVSGFGVGSYLLALQGAVQWLRQQAG